jgi:hypothetical protein
MITMNVFRTAKQYPRAEAYVFILGMKSKNGYFSLIIGKRRFFLKIGIFTYLKIGISTY